jgi:predicted DNA-binding transcriptional regulator YafY
MSGATKRNVGLVRALSLLRVLEGRGHHTLDDLAQRFNVTTRTIRRDLAALQEVGYPIGHEGTNGGQGHNGKWWLLC